MNSSKTRPVLVAGGAGFIGSHLSRDLLKRGHHVVCLDNFLTGLPRNVEALRSSGRFTVLHADVIENPPDWLRPIAIFNLACAASPPHYQADPIHTMLTSVVGTRNLLALAQDTGARFVMASTSEVYGDPDVHPQPESYLGNVNPTGPRACYDEGKRAAEALSFDYRRTHQVDVRVARIFNTYGPCMRPDDGRVITNLLTQALAGRDVTLYGSGQQTRSFCYVDDMVDALLRLMETEVELPGPINLGNPQEITIAELAARALRLTRSRSRVIYLPLPVDDPRRRCPDITRATTLLDWRPEVALEDGLGRTIAWLKADEAETMWPRRRQASRGAGADVAPVAAAHLDGD